MPFADFLTEIELDVAAALGEAPSERRSSTAPPLEPAVFVLSDAELWAGSVTGARGSEKGQLLASCEAVFLWWTAI